MSKKKACLIAANYMSEVAVPELQCLRRGKEILATQRLGLQLLRVHCHGDLENTTTLNN